MYALFCPAAVSVLMCYQSFPTPVEDDWTVSRVLDVLSAREDALDSLEAMLEISQLVPEGLRKYQERRQESVRLMAEAYGKSPPALKATQAFWVVPPYRLRYLRGTGGLERMERFDQDTGSTFLATPSAIYTCDRQHWWTLVRNNATRGDGRLVPREGRFVGLDVEWNKWGHQPLMPRSLSRALKDLNAMGFVHTATGKASVQPGMVGLVVRYPAGPPLPEAVLSQHVLSFSPELSMAPVSHLMRLVKRVGEEFVEQPDWSETKWEDFKEVSAGVWLPARCWTSSHQTVLFPKTGDKYPVGFDFDRAFPRDYRVEAFVTAQTQVRVIDYKCGHAIDPNAFKLGLPRDVLLRDLVDDKMYQTSDLIPVTLEEDIRQSLAASRASGEFRVWIWLTIVNLVFLSAFCAWSWLRRRRDRLRCSGQATSQPRA